MKSSTKQNIFKKFALALSLCLLLIWVMLGAGVSLAWFSDTSEEVTNIFHIADFELTVSHRTDDGKWEEIDGRTDIFDENALYEPGYVQVVYLKVENTGDRAFDFHTAVSVTDFTVATNVFGQKFWIHEYLRFGVAAAESEAEMEEKVSSREKASKLATMKLQNYDNLGVASLEAGECAYLALVVRMPEEVGNEANYRGDTVPRVDLGIIVKADQQKN